MTKHCLYMLLFMSYLALTIATESFYTINAPGTIKSNRKYSVVLALHEASEPSTMRISIQGPGFNDTKDINLQPYESKLVDFLPNKLIHGDYTLKAESLSGLSFQNSSKIYAEAEYGPKIYIQTDKAIYKPQDIVRFRVVILDEHTRPLNVNDPINVEILDKTDNRVQQFKNISLTHGVYNNKFHLSKYPIKGTWKIKVILGGRYDYSSLKTISVSNYLLPKFSVYLKTPSDLVLEDGFIKVGIFGKYTFNKYVEGNATIELWNKLDRILLQTQHIDVENLGFVEFNITNEKDLESAYGLTVKAKLSEKHTGITVSYDQDIILRKQRYDLEIKYDEIEFENNKPYLMKVHVKHWTGAPVLDYKTPVIMEHGDKKYEAFLNKDGVATFEFEHDQYANHKFQFKDSKTKFPNIYTSANLMLENREYYCRLKLLDQNLKLGKPVQIEVSSLINIPYLMYTLMGHASLIRTEHIKVPPNQKSYIITITPTIEMIPESYIYVYYVHKGNLRYEEMSLRFPYEFENQISLRAPKQAKPGENVTIEINAQTNSYVSILAVDMGVYLLDNSYDFNRGDILGDLSKEKSYSPIYASVYPGLVSGLLTLTNAHYPFETLNNFVAVKSLIPQVLKFRKKFPETWIFDNLFVNETTTKLTLLIPDTITTWRITAFSNNEVTGFGIVNKPTDITTVQPFFITINLPYSVKRGEIVTVPITIFNYLKQNVDTEIVLYNNDLDFYFMESKIQGVEKSNDEQSQKVKHITIAANKGKTVKFLIYPIKSGEIYLRVTATTALHSDAVVEKLKVEPEGVIKEKNQALYLSIPQGEKLVNTLNILNVEESVPNSTYITFSVGGHYLVPTLENFHELIQTPTGCGEPNMINFAPNVLILQYLKANDKLILEENLVKSLIEQIEMSYQQQLAFRHENGGFSVFGMGTDEEPNTWLTAYVIRYFIKASKFVAIEERIIESGLEYLAQQQLDNGEFPFNGYLLKPNHRNEYGLTAFIILTFLEDQKYASKYEKTIQNALEFLNSNTNNIDDIHALCQVATAIKRAKHQNAQILVKQLQTHVKEDNGLKWWSANDQNLANDIEITSYAALTLLDTPGDHTSILKWLIGQCNSKGGFKSSYDTVVGMEALVKFSEKYKNSQNINLKLTYIAKDQEGMELAENTFHIDSTNILDLQKHELPTDTHIVNFVMEGNGASLVQLTQQYNIINSQEFRYFHIQPKVIVKNPAEITLNICFTYQTDSGITNEISNMLIMEINLPTGYKSEAENDKTLKQNDLVQKIEWKNEQKSTIILYLDKLEVNNFKCLDIDADKTSDILMPKPAAILMYDYYNLTRSNIEFYDL